MSGPIVRSGPSKEYSENWGNVFGEGNAEKKRTAKPAKKKTSKKKKPLSRGT